MLKFLKGIFSNTKHHDDNAYWIREEANKNKNLLGMEHHEVSSKDIIKNAPNWKAPGKDKVRNYWQ